MIVSKAGAQSRVYLGLPSSAPLSTSHICPHFASAVLTLPILLGRHLLGAAFSLTARAGHRLLAVQLDNLTVTSPFPLSTWNSDQLRKAVGLADRAFV